MNILLLTTHLNPGGVSRYVINLAKGLEKNHKVWVASWGGEWQKYLSKNGAGFKFIPINTKSILSIKVIFSLFVLLPFVVKEKIDLIHANTRVTQFLAYLLYRATGIKYLSSFHGFYKPRIWRRLLKFEGLRTIAVSRAVRDHLINDLYIEESKIRVVYNGIDLEEFASKRYTKNDFGFKEDDIVVGILGRISEEKGHFLTLETFRILQSKYKNIYLLISGEGRLKQRVKQILTQESFRKRARFINQEGQDFLDLIDILVVASSREGFGYTILEAFAKGVCVVGFSTGGIKEIIEDRENGILFYNYTPQDLKNALEILIENGTLRRDLIAKAKHRLKKFNLENMIVETQKVYQEVLNI
jgi:glycosyltransferase involved in cell wall biosynthesis